MERGTSSEASRRTRRSLKQALDLNWSPRMIRSLRNLSFLILFGTSLAAAGGRDGSDPSTYGCTVIPFCDGNWTIYDSCNPETCNDVLADCVSTCGGAPYSFDCSPPGGNNGPADHGSCQCTGICA